MTDEMAKTSKQRREQIRLARRNRKEIKRWVPDEKKPGQTCRKSFYGETLEDAKQSYLDYLNPPLRVEVDNLALELREHTVPWWFVVKLLPLKDHNRKNSIDTLQLAARHLLPELEDVMIWELSTQLLVQKLNIIERKETLRNGNAKPKPVRQPDGSVVMVAPAPKYKKVSASLVNKCRRLALEINDLAYDEMADEEDRARRVKKINSRRVPIRKEPKRDVPIYSPQMVHCLIEGCRGTTSFAPSILYGVLGLRLNEGLGALTTDLTSDGVLEVTYQDDGNGELTEDLKTENARRDLWLPQSILEELRPLTFAKSSGPIRLARGVDKTTKTGIKYGRPLRENNVVRNLKKIMTRLGLPVTTPHGLRHSVNSWHDNNGTPRSVKLAIMGHADEDVNDGYSHADYRKMRDAFARWWQESLKPLDYELKPVIAKQGTKTPAKHENNGRARLDRAKVREIRRRLGENEPATNIAPDFGVHPSLIRRIKNGKAWSDVA